MGPGCSQMRDILWGLSSNSIDTTEIRIFGNLTTNKNAPAPSIIQPVI